jgi:hypothetical protein
MTEQTPLAAQDIYSIMWSMWEADATHHSLMVQHMVDTLHEVFDDPPNRMRQRERNLLKKINELEAEILQLESKMMIMGSGLSSLSLGIRLGGDTSDKNIVEAVRSFVPSLEKAHQEILKSVEKSHTSIMDLRSELLEGYD